MLGVLQEDSNLARMSILFVSTARERRRHYVIEMKVM